METGSGRERVAQITNFAAQVLGVVKGYEILKDSINSTFSHRQNKISSDTLKVDTVERATVNLNKGKITVSQACNTMTMANVDQARITKTIALTGKKHSSGFQYGKDSSRFVIEKKLPLSQAWWLNQNRGAKAGWKKKNKFGEEEWVSDSTSVVDMKARAEDQDLTGFGKSKGRSTKKGKEKGKGGGSGEDYTGLRGGGHDENETRTETENITEMQNEEMENKESSMAEVFADGYEYDPSNDCGNEKPSQNSVYMSVPPYMPEEIILERISFFELPAVRGLEILLLISVGTLVYLRRSKTVQKLEGEESTNDKFLIWRKDIKLARFIPWVAEYDKKEMEGHYQVLQDFTAGRISRAQAAYMLRKFFGVKEEDLQQILDMDKTS